MPKIQVNVQELKGYYALFYLLPPENEVWGKVIFLHLFVILFRGVGGGVPAPMGMSAPGGCLLPGGSGPRGVPGGDPPERLLLRAVRILLECILVGFAFTATFDR